MRSQLLPFSCVPIIYLWPSLIRAALLSPIVVNKTTNTVPAPFTTHNCFSSTTGVNVTGTINATICFDPKWRGLGTDPVKKDNNRKYDRFFEATSENIKASNYKVLYTEFIMRVDKNGNPWNDRLSEPDFFAKSVLEWPGDVRCSTGDHGCQGQPDCQTIVTLIEDRHKARAICFIFMAIDNMFQIAGAVSEQSNHAQTDLTDMAGQFASTWFWQHDEAIAKKCKFYAGLANAAIAAVILTSVAGLGFVAGRVAPAVEAVEAEAAEGAEAASAASKAPWLTRGIFAKLPPQVSWSQFIVSAQKGKRSIIIQTIISYPVAIGGGSIEASICAHFPNAAQQAKEHYRDEVMKSIGNTLIKYGEYIDFEMALINEGHGTGPEGEYTGSFTSVLTEAMNMGDYVRLTPEEQDFYIDEPSKVEGAIKDHFKNAEMSFALKSSMCYIHCTPDLADGSPNVVINGWTVKANTTGSRLFHPEPGLSCQPQCWQNWIHTKQIRMFGLEELYGGPSEHGTDWGISAEEFIGASFKLWRESRYSSEDDIPDLGQLLRNERANTTSGSSLPVCYSLQPLADLSSPSLSRARPCICGDKFGNETDIFLEETNMQSWIALDKKESLAQACQISFDIGVVEPVAVFMAFCQLGWHFPYAHEGREFIEGQDRYCHYFDKEVRELDANGTTWRDINCYMCIISGIGQGLILNQQNYVNTHHGGKSPSNYHFKNACAAFIPDCPNKKDFHHKYEPSLIAGSSP